MVSSVAAPRRCLSMNHPHPSHTPPTPPPIIQLFPCLMLHILSFFTALAVRDPLLPFLLRMCVRGRKRQCNNLRGILSLKDRVQLQRVEPPSNTQKLPQLFVSRQLLQSQPVLSPPVTPLPSLLPQSHNHLPAPAIFSEETEKDRGPLHGLIKASTEQTAAFIFQR